MVDIKRKKKPRGKPFPKGVSGNPTGKRRRLATVDDVFMVVVSLYPSRNSGLSRDVLDVAKSIAPCSILCFDGLCSPANSVGERLHRKASPIPLGVTDNFLGRLERPTGRPPRPHNARSLAD